ncbi:MAG: diguanylate cyclase [Pseudobdellovibrionaceae bacterium]|nr:diguanylate cyclase [Pseudobdellovibrionaceae bacterium]
MPSKDKMGKVLIVAGSAESLMHYQAQLAQYRTETALTAETAMDAIDDFEPDVVVIDEKLPAISGIELAQWIRSDQAAPHYYGILMVASSRSKNLSELVQLSGADTACSAENLKNDLAARVALLIKFKMLSDKANSLLTKLNQSKETIRELEDQDSITRLYNLPYMNARLEKELRHAERFGTPLTLMIMFIDNFKEVSHIKGPTFCIKMLQQLGNDLIHLTRADDVVGRSWGGEFILILPETKEDGAENLKSRIVHYISEHLYGLDHDRIAIELSFGVHTFQAEEGKQQSIQEMLLSAEDDLTRQLQTKSERSSKKAVNG